MLQKKYIWVPFLFGFFILSAIVSWLNESQDKVSSYETATENLKERLVTSNGIVRENLQESSSSRKTENTLDNCNFLYLDMGTNFGVQIRHLFDLFTFNLFLFLGSSSSLIFTPGLQSCRCLTNISGNFRLEIIHRSEIFSYFIKIFLKSPDLCCWLGAQLQTC